MFPKYQEESCSFVFFWLLYYSLKIFKATLLYSNSAIEKTTKITKVPANYIMQYQLNFSYIKQSNTTFSYSVDLSLYKKDSLLQSHWAMSRFHIKFPMNLSVKLSEKKLYHQKSLCKWENILKKVLGIMFVNLVR